MKSDARVRYTKMRIREAFYQCLAGKPVNRITVRELCEIAEINRATFYTHYRDPYDLLEKLEQETIEELQRFIEQKRCAGENVLPVLIGKMGSDEHQRLLVSDHGDPTFATRISALFYDSYMVDVENLLPASTAAEREMAYRFLAGGCGSVMKMWFSGGQQEDESTFAEQLVRLCEAFLEAFEKALSG